MKQVSLSEAHLHEDIRKALCTYLSDGESHEPLITMCQYALFPTGKLIRPFLLMEGCKLVGGMTEALLPAASGAEYAHVASLIHDDIIDRDDVRRGRKALHQLYGFDQALLTGDFLIFQAFLALARCQDLGISPDRVVRAFRVVALVGMDLCRGQALESEVAGNLNCNEETYLQIIRLKTASFFRGALESGAVLGNGSDEQIALLAEYGEHLGIIFQIVDDLLCYMGEVEVLGKPVISDLKNKRLTLPIIFAYQDGDATVRTKLDQLFHNSFSHSDYAKLIHILVDTSAIERSRKLALEYAKEAEKILMQLPDNPSRHRLRSYINLCFNRNR